MTDVTSAILATLLVAPLVMAQPQRERALPTVRKTTPAHFRLPLERYQLRNGLTVLLSPDPSAASVLVETTYRAGTIFEEPGTSGMAHLVEHVLSVGAEAGPKYMDELEARGASDLNAWTTPDRMVFHAVVPPHELPLALWAESDRIGRVAALVTYDELPRHKSVVEAERGLRVLDAPYGNLFTVLMARAYPSPHPLHGSVIGVTEELENVTVQHVTRFIERLIVPANCVLTVVGKFDPKWAKAEIKRRFAGLPAGARAKVPTLPKPPRQDARLAVKEHIGRRPRVTRMWRLGPDINDQSADALALGSTFLTVSTDGAFGTSVRGSFRRDLGGSAFVIDVTLPYDKPLKSAEGELEVFRRYLTHVPTEPEVIDAALMFMDRGVLHQLDSLSGRAVLLAEAELMLDDARKAERAIQNHWDIDPRTVRQVANVALGGVSSLVHMRPLDPIKARARKERY